jgi:uncharacterized protein
VRAVLDANVLVSALLSRHGAPALLLVRWLAGAYELVVSERLLSEVERTLAYPKIERRVARDDAAGFLRLLREAAQHIADPEAPPARSADPGDDYLVALAEASAAILVSGDRHLLELSGTLPVMTPRDFLDALEQ